MVSVADRFELLDFTALRELLELLDLTELFVLRVVLLTVDLLPLRPVFGSLTVFLSEVTLFPVLLVVPDPERVLYLGSFRVLLVFLTSFLLETRLLYPYVDLLVSGVLEYLVYLDPPL